MIRPRDPARIRADALRVGAEKQLAGCDACAEGYFALARQHGATDEDIRRALSEACRNAEQIPVSRRAFLKATAAGAAGVAAAAASGGLLPQPTASAAATFAAVDGAQVAWLWGLRAQSIGGEHRLIGIAPDGAVVGQIDPVPALPQRAPDGSRLYVTWARRDATGSTTVVDVYSAANGAHERTITGRALPLDASQDFDALTPAIRADGRVLAVLHQTRRIRRETVRRMAKPALDGVSTHAAAGGQATITTGIEVIDLQAGRALAYRELDTSDSAMLGGHVEFDPGGTRLYVFTFDRNFDDSVTVVEFNGQSAQVQTRATNGRNGHDLPAAGLTMPPGMRVLPGGATLVRVDASSRVRWFDLRALTLTRELAVTVARKTKPSSPVPLFSPDGALLYLADSAAGTVEAIDIAQGTQQGFIALPQPGGTPGAQPRRASGRGTAALAPDGTRLYLLDSRAAAGLALVRLPDLQVIDRVLPDRALRAVWPAPGGHTVFALGQTDGLVHVVRGDGGVANVLQVDKDFYGFVSTN